MKTSQDHVDGMMTLTRERAQFERWYEVDALPLEHSNWFALDEDGDYVIDRVQRDWSVWKSARASEPPTPTEENVFIRIARGDMEALKSVMDGARNAVLKYREQSEPGREAGDAVLEAISKAGAFSAEIPCAVTVHFEYGPDAWDLLHSLHALKKEQL